MSLNITEYERKPFDVRAVQLTPDNWLEVARWCTGIPKDDGEKDGEVSRNYIIVYPARKDKPALIAKMGDFVVKAGARFSVYPSVSFHRTFVEKKPSGKGIRVDAPKPGPHNEPRGAVLKQREVEAVPGVEVAQSDVVDTPVDINGFPLPTNGILVSDPTNLTINGVTYNPQDQQGE